MTLYDKDEAAGFTAKKETTLRDAVDMEPRAHQAESHERTRNADEEYLVYSAYLSDGLLNDVHDWSVGGPVLVVVKDTTSPGENLRFQALYALDGRIRFDGLYRVNLPRIQKRRP